MYIFSCVGRGVGGGGVGEINRLGQLAPGGEDNLGQLAPGGGGGGQANHGYLHPGGQAIQGAR